MSKVLTAICLNLSLLLVILMGFGASADNSCRGRDLRHPELNRPYTQVFLNAEGKVTDSSQCASFSSALLMSQQLGVSINPVDAAVQNSIAILAREDKKLADLFKSQHLGYCKQMAVDTYLKKEQNNFIQIFNDFVHHLNPNVDAYGYSEMTPNELQKISQWLDGICGERISIGSFIFSRIDLKPGDQTTVSPSEGGSLMSAIELGEKIDGLIDAGRFVSYTHGYHAVTIVGRTDDCRYIIQDSIPESAWNAFGGMNTLSDEDDRAQITFKDQYFQYWPRAILLKNAANIEFLEIPPR